MNNPANIPEPNPVNQEAMQPAVWNLVINDFEISLSFKGEKFKIGLLQLMKDRNAFGTKKYRVPLKANNGRSFINDSIQENLDPLAYLRGLLCEEKHPYKTWLIEEAYRSAQESIILLYEYSLTEEQ